MNKQQSSIDCAKNQKRVNRSNWLLNQPVIQVMVQLSLPMLPAIIAVIGLDLFDAFLVSGISTETLAALSFTIPVTSSLFALAIGFSVGTVSVLSYSLGRGEHHKSQRIATDSLLISILFALMITVLGLLSIPPLFNLLGANFALIPESFHLGPRPDIMPEITNYMQLRYIGFVFMLITLLSNSVMRATGDTKFAGKLMLAWASLTALVDYLFIASAGQEANLASLGKGHLVTDILFAIISIIILIKRENILDFSLPSYQTLSSNCRAILKISLPASGMGLLTPLTIGIITSWVAFYGREAVAAFGVISRIESLALFIPMALSTSLPIFVGQNFGAGCINRSREAINKSLLLTVTAQVFIVFLLILIAEPLASSFSDSEVVVQLITFLLYLLPIGYAGKGVAILVGSSLNAIHRPHSAFILTLIKMCFLYVPAAYIGAYFYGLNGLFVGLMVANLLMGLTAYVWLSLSLKPN